MHSISYLTPFLVNVTLGVVLLLGKKAHSYESEGITTYYFPPTYSRLFIFIGIFLAAAPFFPGAQGTANPILFFGTFFVFSASALIAAFYFARYKVVVGSNTFVVGAFQSCTFQLSEIKNTKLVMGQKSGDYFVYLHNGKRLRFSGLLTDFHFLTETLQPPVSEELN